MIDLRSASIQPPGVSSAFSEMMKRQSTRFIWMRVCEHCLCRSTVIEDGIRRCQGCYRTVTVGDMEGNPPQVVP